MKPIIYSRLFIRSLLLVLLLSACKSEEILCPEPKRYKARRVMIPQTNYKQEPKSARQERSIQKMREQQLEARASKTPQAAEEWDCPRPGVKRQYSRFVKSNIKKNTKKINSYYKKRAESDSILTLLPAKHPR